MVKPLQNTIERPNGEIMRRTNVVGIFPNDEAIVRLVGAILLERNNEWGGATGMLHDTGNYRAVALYSIVRLATSAH